MIPLVRSRDQNSMHVNFFGVRRSELTLGLLKRERAIRARQIDPETGKPFAKHVFDSDIWKKAKDQLLAETHDKCAYCEAPTAVVAYGDVEHYRPKSIYWWLAYSVDNFLASCTICNQRFKSDKFPVSSARTAGPKVTAAAKDAAIEVLVGGVTPDPLNQASFDAFLHSHAAEGAQLVNPYYQNPSQFFAWKADDRIEEVELIAIAGNPASALAVKRAVDNYGLNRLELKQLRYVIHSAWKTHRLTLTDPGISPATRDLNAQQITRMQQADRPFAGMVRYFETIGLP